MKFPCPTCGSTEWDLSDDFLVVNVGETCAKCGDISYETDTERLVVCPCCIPPPPEHCESVVFATPKEEK